MKVLIAVDDTEASQDAISMARELFAPHTQAVIVNVAQAAWAPYLWADPVAAAWQPVPPIRSGLDETAETLARAAADQLDDSEADVEHGDPAAAILRTAQEEEVDLIVVGTHDKGLWEKWWFGSVSDHVVRHAPCSVLVVR